MIRKKILNSARNIILPFNTLPGVFLLLLLLIPFLAQCGMPQKKETQTKEVLQAVGFRLVDSPREVVSWRYHYVNRTFPAPSYRTPEGSPRPGWCLRVKATRRFFTNQSARIYYRVEDLQQSYLFSSPYRAAAGMMRIWPVGATLVLETFSGRGALVSNATPVFADCIRKFEPDGGHFPVDTLFAGEWSYQRFSGDGKARAMPGGASACHQCHGTALPLTGDLVFTVFPDDKNSEIQQK